MWLIISALCKNVFVGIHPRFKHVPPNSRFSTNATFPPNWAALIAATYPAGPPPITATSYSPRRSRFGNTSSFLVSGTLTSAATSFTTSWATAVAPSAPGTSSPGCPIHAIVWTTGTVDPAG